MLVNVFLTDFTKTILGVRLCEGSTLKGETIGMQTCLTHRIRARKMVMGENC